MAYAIYLHQEEHRSTSSCGHEILNSANGSTDENILLRFFGGGFGLDNHNDKDDDDAATDVGANVTELVVTTAGRGFGLDNDNNKDDDDDGVGRFDSIGGGVATLPRFETFSNAARATSTGITFNCSPFLSSHFLLLFFWLMD